MKIPLKTFVQSIHKDGIQVPAHNMVLKCERWQPNRPVHAKIILHNKIMNQNLDASKRKIGKRSPALIWVYGRKVPNNEEQNIANNMLIHQYLELVKNSSEDL